MDMDLNMWQVLSDESKIEYLSNNAKPLLLLVCEKGELELFQLIINDLERLKQDVNPGLIINNEGEKLIHKAAASGSVNLCRYLLENLQLPLNVNTNHNTNPLDYAAEQGHKEVLDYLIKIDPIYFSQICNDNKQSMQLLQYAVQGDNLDIFVAMYKAIVQVIDIAITKTTLSNLFNQAVKFGHFKIAKCLWNDCAKDEETKKTMFLSYDCRAFTSDNNLEFAKWLWNDCVNHTASQELLYKAFTAACAMGNLKTALWLWNDCVKDEETRKQMLLTDDCKAFTSAVSKNIELAKWLWNDCAKDEETRKQMLLADDYKAFTTAEYINLESAKWLLKQCADDDIRIKMFVRLQYTIDHTEGIDETLMSYFWDVLSDESREKLKLSDAAEDDDATAEDDDAAAEDDDAADDDYQLFKPDYSLSFLNFIFKKLDLNEKIAALASGALGFRWVISMFQANERYGWPWCDIEMNKFQWMLSLTNEDSGEDLIFTQAMRYNLLVVGFKRIADSIIKYRNPDDWPLQIEKKIYTIYYNECIKIELNKNRIEEKLSTTLIKKVISSMGRRPAVFNEELEDRLILKEVIEKFDYNILLDIEKVKDFILRCRHQDNKVSIERGVMVSEVLDLFLETYLTTIVENKAFDGSFDCSTTTDEEIEGAVLIENQQKIINFLAELFKLKPEIISFREKISDEHVTKNQLAAFYCASAVYQALNNDDEFRLSDGGCALFEDLCESPSESFRQQDDKNERIITIMHWAVEYAEQMVDKQDVEDATDKANHLWKTLMCIIPQNIIDLKMEPPETLDADEATADNTAGDDKLAKYIRKKVVAYLKNLDADAAMQKNSTIFGGREKRKPLSMNNEGAAQLSNSSKKPRVGGVAGL